MSQRESWRNGKMVSVETFGFLKIFIMSYNTGLFIVSPCSLWGATSQPCILFELYNNTLKTLNSLPLSNTYYVATFTSVEVVASDWLRSNLRCSLFYYNRKTKFQKLSHVVVDKISAKLLVGKNEYISTFLFTFDQMCPTLLTWISNHKFLARFKYQCVVPYNKLFNTVSCFVLIEKC